MERFSNKPRVKELKHGGGGSWSPEFRLLTTELYKKHKGKYWNWRGTEYTTP